MSKYSLILPFLLLTNAVAAAPNPEPSSTEKSAPIILAQNQTDPKDIDLDEINIFERIKIDLHDLETLGQEVVQRLVGEQLRLTLDECVLMALQGNQDILIIGYEALLANSDTLSARGEFDPVLSGRFQQIDSVTPPSPTQALFGGLTFDIENTITDYQLQLAGKWEWGTQYTIELVSNREKGTFTTDPNTFQQIPSYTGGITTTLTQPILRGRGSKVNLVRIRTAQNSQLISLTQIRQTLLTTVGQVIKAYWDLVGAVDNLQVRQEALDNAMRLVHINEQRLNIGTAAAIEVLQAKAGAATRQSDLIVARTQILDSEDLLKSLIGLQDGRIFSAKSIVPTERPGSTEYDWDLNLSIDRALKNRPEIHAAELQIENADLDKTRTRNELLPQIDATLSYNQNSRQLSFNDLPGGIRDKDGRNWVIGVQGSIPIGNRTARGAYTRSKLIKRQQQQRLKKAQQDAMLAVRNAVRGVVSSQILVESTRQARILQEANVAAEEKRLKLGVTTSQNVLDIQEDLTQAQTQELQSQVSFEKAVIDLQVSEGTLLENLAINFESPYESETPSFLKSISPSR